MLQTIRTLRATSIILQQSTEEAEIAWEGVKRKEHAGTNGLRDKIGNQELTEPAILFFSFPIFGFVLFLISVRPRSPAVR